MPAEQGIFHQFDHEVAQVDPDEIDQYYHKFQRDFRGYFDKPICELRIHPFPDHMPLPLVDSARKTVLLSWIYGDNFRKSFFDTAIAGHTLTFGEDAAGPNTQELGIVYAYLEARQDKRARKKLSDETDEQFIAKGQGVTLPFVADMVAGVAHAKYIVTLDLHSKDAQDTFENRGVKVFNVLPVPELVAKVNEFWDLSDETIMSEFVLGTTDYGSLPRALAVRNYIKKMYGVEVPIVLIGKDRTADGLGTASTVEQTLISGDLTDKRVLICDDILGSGESLNNAYQIASEEHAKEVILYVTHSVNYKDYYNTIQGVLMNDKVRAIISTDSLPTEGRYMGGTSIPKTEDGSKAVTILPVAESLAKVARTIVESPTYDEAIDLLEDYICPLYDPKELAQTVFGVTPIKRRDVGIYTRSKNYVLFEDLL